ncbi:TIGR02452 family protein [Streptomyces triticagri]|uniref:TIGR02452 family protein n=1 Tax=Streptomyces triticagri TaxID=2293568 RepID=A0A372MAZ7_9ACTN|nr:TIGR02452 family protein [Streptomyces triticagri]RFU88122.1 TIGR02452 family protein [Streptomyces triticagri]
MSARLRATAQHTQEIVAAGHYVLPDGRRVDLAADVAAAADGTALFGPEPVAAGDARTGSGADRAASAATRFETTAESSLEAAHRLLTPPADAPAEGADPVAVLNFASARNPGGGFLNGAQAQEEALCRASALYHCLLRAPDYYAHHRADRDPFYTDRVIHSPGVPVFRDDRGALLQVPYRVGFLTSPAPNAGVILSRTPDAAPRIAQALARRAERVLETATACGYRRLVLGAWGCGVFRNDPAQVAAAFRALLADGGRFEAAFSQVVFAVLDRTRAATTLGAFTDAFADLTADTAP